MIYVYLLLQNCSCTGAMVYLVMHDHPWWALVCALGLTHPSFKRVQK